VTEDGTDFAEALEARMRDIASACTQCGNCFQVCPMTHAVGLSDAEPRRVLGGIVDLLNGNEGTPEAQRWAAACSMSGICVEACDYGVNPRIMVRLAHFANTRRCTGAAARGNATLAFRGMARAVRIVSRLQLDESALNKLQPPLGRTVPPRRPDVVLYTGCNVHKTPHILILCLEVLAALGLTYEVVGGPSACCGIFHLLSGDAESSGRTGLHALRQIKDMGASQMTSWCPSCQTQFDEIILPNVERVTGEVPFALTPFFVFLEQRLEQLRPQLKNPVKKRVALNERPGIPAVTRAVKRILQAIPELEFVELDVPRVGLMSNYLAVTPRLKDELREAEFCAAAAAGVTTLATVFHACHRELCHWEKNVSFEIVNVMELIGESMGIHADDVYKRLKMMDDVEAMMSEVRELIGRYGLDENEAREVLLADHMAARALQGAILQDTAGIRAG
jgi:heterodisulfide reductase subunit D